MTSETIYSNFILFTCFHNIQSDVALDWCLLSGMASPWLFIATLSDDCADNGDVASSLALEAALVFTVQPAFVSVCVCVVCFFVCVYMLCICVRAFVLNHHNHRRHLHHLQWPARGLEHSTH